MSDSENQPIEGRETWTYSIPASVLVRACERQIKTLQATADALRLKRHEALTETFAKIEAEVSGGTGHYDMNAHTYAITIPPDAYRAARSHQGAIAHAEERIRTLRSWIAKESIMGDARRTLTLDDMALFEVTKGDFTP